MLGYNWGGTTSTAVNYGGHDLPVINQNFGGHSVPGGNGAADQLLDLETDVLPQDFGIGSMASHVDSGALENATAAKEDKAYFSRLTAVMEDFYSFDHAMTALPALRTYFNIPSDGPPPSGGPGLMDVRRFLSPAQLENQGLPMVLGLDDQTLESPPKPVNHGNRSSVITPAVLIEMFERKDAFEPSERFHIRKNIVACLTALADFQRGKHAGQSVNTDRLIHAVQECRLNCCAQYQFSQATLGSVRSEADQQAHVRELAQRTLARVQQASNVELNAGLFDQYGLQRPGNIQAKNFVQVLQHGPDALIPGRLSRLTLDQLADLVVEVNAGWRLPVKAAMGGALADYLSVPLRDIPAAKIDSTMHAVVDWACGGASPLPDIADILPCIPCIGRKTTLEMDRKTSTVAEVALKNGQNFLLPSAIAKALKAQQVNLEKPVADLIRNQSFYSCVYRRGKNLKTALNLHGMYLQCSNPANHNMAFQTAPQFNHPSYAVRCARGLYVNVNQPARPLLECREGETLRLTYIDRLWSLFRVIVADALEARLAEKLAQDDRFMNEDDPEARRTLAGTILDTCVPETFGGAGGNLTGMARNIVINAAIERAGAH